MSWKDSLPILKRYWIKFKVLPTDPYPLGLVWGCGVTAYTQEDALSLVSEHIFTGGSLPPIETIMENIDISTLDAGHVLPNMGVPVWRGIWFPQGYHN